MGNYISYYTTSVSITDQLNDNTQGATENIKSILIDIKQFDVNNLKHIETIDQTNGMSKKDLINYEIEHFNKSKLRHISVNNNNGIENKKIPLRDQLIFQVKQNINIKLKHVEFDHSENNENKMSLLTEIKRGRKLRPVLINKYKSTRSSLLTDILYQRSKLKPSVPHSDLLIKPKLTKVMIDPRIASIGRSNIRNYQLIDNSELKQKLKKIN